MDQNYTAAFVNASKVSNLAPNNHLISEKGMSLPAIESQMRQDSESLIVCEFDSGEFDALDIDLPEFYKHVWQNFTCVTRMKSIEPRSYDSTIYRLSFESGIPLHGAVTMVSLWELAVSAVSALADLENAGLFYPCVIKTKFVFSIRDGQYRLVNPFSCPNFLEQVLAVNFNRQADPRVKQSLCSDQIRRNLRELALCFVSLLSDNFAENKIQTKGSINCSIRYLKSHNQHRMADFLTLCLSAKGPRPTARLKEFLQFNGWIRPDLMSDACNKTRVLRHATTEAIPGLLSTVYCEQVLNMQETQLSKPESPVVKFAKSLTNSPKSTCDQQTAPHSSSKLSRDLQDDRLASPEINHSDILDSSSCKTDEMLYVKPLQVFTNPEELFQERPAKISYEGLERSSLLLLEEIENDAVQSSIDVSDAVSYESIELNSPEIDSPTYLGFSRLENYTSVTMNIVSELTKCSPYDDMESDQLLKGYRKNVLMTLEDWNQKLSLENTKETSLRESVADEILANLDYNKGFLRAENLYIPSLESSSTETENGLIFIDKQAVTNAWNSSVKSRAEGRFLRAMFKSHYSYKFRYLPLLECVPEELGESEESQEE